MSMEILNHAHHGCLISLAVSYGTILQMFLFFLTTPTLEVRTGSSGCMDVEHIHSTYACMLIHGPIEPLHSAMKCFLWRN